ncbi:DUF3237 family protein [Sphingomonas glacialis]|uniref:UPF0311 protein EAH76_03920 n=1 Tax=Sphingomonas glacialis TaxID=658225 RepID=A0A502FWR4_9SPHN|nr:DUF3237 family protein [Sphingomonas glacialis]TPG53871.1 DUF3237 domain-containing protein [Sphingomonas glacialis]
MMESLTSRRTVLGAMAMTLLPLALPTPAQALPQGPVPVPPPEATPRVEFAFSAHVLLEPTREIGRTPYGIRRRIPIIGGTFEGPRISGRIIPGGADWQIQRADDYTVLEADYMIEAADGTQIHVRNRGLTNTRVAGAKARYLRTVPEFEAPTGPHDWLNQSVFVGSLQSVSGGPPAVIVHVFRLA